MSEDEFEYNGKTYIAVDSKGCDFCAMVMGGECLCLGDDAQNIPQCYGDFRIDKRNVHFEEKQ
jgi:hypothetical protein